MLKNRKIHWKWLSFQFWSGKSVSFSDYLRIRLTSGGRPLKSSCGAGAGEICATSTLGAISYLNYAEFLGETLWKLVRAAQRGPMCELPNASLGVTARGLNLSYPPGEGMKQNWPKMKSKAQSCECPLWAPASNKLRNEAHERNQKFCGFVDEARAGFGGSRRQK